MSDATAPARELILEPLADRGLFMLIDPDAPLPSWPFQMSSPENLAEIAVPTNSGVGFISAGRDFYPTVYIRISVGPAEPESGTWDAAGEAELTVISGYLSLRSAVGDVAGMFELTSGDWRLRWQVRGREKARRRSAGGNLFFHGVEEWFLQMWPVPAS